MKATPPGFRNTAIGPHALVSCTTGNDNTAMGVTALASNTTGSNNTANGVAALFSNTTGSFNTAVGTQTLANNTTGSFNIALRGGSNLTTGNFNIDIGSDGVAGESDTIRTGDGCCQSRAFIAGIFGTAVSGSIVVVDANGQLGVPPSSSRFKNEIKRLKQASEVIYGLKPVSFRYKPEIDPACAQQFGLAAEDVEAVNPDLVVRDKKGRPYSVRYDQVNAMLLNEFLKEHRKGEEQERKIREQERSITRLKNQFETLNAQQRKEMQLLRQQLKDQAAQIQRAAAEAEMHDSALASQVAVNSP